MGLSLHTQMFRILPNSLFHFSRAGRTCAMYRSGLGRTLLLCQIAGRNLSVSIITFSNLKIRHFETPSMFAPQMRSDTLIRYVINLSQNFYANLTRARSTLSSHTKLSCP